LMNHEVAGDRDKERVRLLLMGGAEAGLEQGGRCVDALGVAGFLEVGEVRSLGGRGRTVENGSPAGCGRGEESGEFGGVVEGVEVNIGEEERRHGGGGAGGRLGAGG